MARPSKYTQKIADQICERLADGESLKRICSGDEMPNKATVFRWLDAHKSFRDMYVRAREAQADSLADEIIDIADDGVNDTIIDDNGSVRINYDVVARSKLRVDARKWVAAKLKPRVYGDKPEQDGPTDIAKALAELIGKLPS
ncbi:terminase small subunit-like protein [Metapseudomonas otitidis]|uniref:terminase small subunit-like protein n=1 Tax=Metapseudomonas otitidis TaxID=319939 RepID=UPI00366BC356